MWKCDKCGRSFRNVCQHHFCGKVETIDQYIGEQDESIRPLLEKVREVIRTAAPEAKEKISWQMPTFWQSENLVHFAAHKNHLGFYPGGLSLAPFRDRLEGLNTTKGTIQFPYEKIDFELIAYITKWRVKQASKKEIVLIPIGRNHNVDCPEEYIKPMIEATLEYYDVIGFIPPWISYLVKSGGDYVGTCAFKGAPKNGKAEIAYYTFPPFEGQSYATAMCKALVDIARKTDKTVIVTARTLIGENASTSVLRKNGFALAGTVVDPEDGDVSEWILNPSKRR